jgi:multiple sugar transport system ATP-binding protein
MASVTLRQLTKTFDSSPHPALRDLSLDIEDGEFLVLLGPSGCGKTTALRCIAGLEEPTSGEILIGERLVTHLAPGDRDVAMVFQNHTLYPHLTVRENIAFALEMRRIPRREILRRVVATADRLGLGDLLERRPAELAGGQRQRVALGRALVREPQLFLFDEPLSNLDATLRTELRAELLKLHRQLGATMIFVTHDQVEAMTMGHRIAVLHEGRLRQVGTPAAVYERPADEFVARFLGRPGMNILAGTAEGGGGRGKRETKSVVRCGPLTIPVGLAYAGQIRLGVRPEHVAVCGADQGVGNARVSMVETLGSETLLHLDADGQTIVARLQGDGRFEVPEGEQVGLLMEARHLHFFDASGARIA